MKTARPLNDALRAELEALIGYTFKDKGRIDRATTHSSALAGKGGNYERLEFLGDRVLGLCVAELLFTTFRDAGEGELSVRLNQLVSAESCADVADQLTVIFDSAVVTVPSSSVHENLKVPLASTLA